MGQKMDESKEGRKALRASQLKSFCGKYGLEESAAEIAGGWRKDVLIFQEEVYYLPYSERSNVFIQRECAFHRAYFGRLGAETPRFIRAFSDKEFSDYEICVVSRLSGDAYPVMESMDWPRTRKVFLSLAETFAENHKVEPDHKLFAEYGGSFSPLSGVPLMNHWLSWWLKPKEPEAITGWFVEFIREAAEAAQVDPYLVNETGAAEDIAAKLGTLSKLVPVVLHGDMHDGQFLLSPGSTKIKGIIDWDNFCHGSPLIDFNTTKWFPDRMWLFRKNFQEMRVKMWETYLKARGIKGQWNGGLNLFLIMTELLRVVLEKDRPRIWMTKGPYKEGLNEYLRYLRKAIKG